jgi:hypothetical protein
VPAQQRPRTDTEDRPGVARQRPAQRREQDRFAARGLDRGDAAEGGKGRVAAEPVGVVAGDHEQLAGGVGSDARLGEQTRGRRLDQRRQLALELACFVV